MGCVVSVERRVEGVWVSCAKLMVESSLVVSGGMCPERFALIWARNAAELCRQR